MAFSYVGCAGSSTCDEPNCPGAFTDPTNGTPIQCVAENVGVRIYTQTFRYYLEMLTVLHLV